MHSKKFSDLLQCAKNLLEPQCAVYFSAATNIWSHAARSLFCLAKNWMSQQDAVILHKRVTKLKKYIFLFCLINKNQHDNFHWVSVGAKPFEKQQRYFCICGVYLIYHKQDLRTASSFMVVAHYFSPFILALPYLSLTAQQAQKNNNIVVAHLMCLPFYLGAPGYVFAVQLCLTHNCAKYSDLLGPPLHPPQTLCHRADW